MTKRRKPSDSRTPAKSRTGDELAGLEVEGMAPADDEPADEPAEILIADLPRACQELGITAYYEARLVGNRLEIHAYGGQVRTWPAEEGGE